MSTSVTTKSGAESSIFSPNDSSLHLDHFSSKKSELFLVKLFWLGFVIYTLSYTLATTTYVNYILCELFQAIGLIIFVTASTGLMQFEFDSKYLKFFFIIYNSWMFGVILRGLALDYPSLKLLLFDAWFGIFIYLAPLIMLFPKRLALYRKAFGIIVVLGVFYILFDLLFIKNLLDADLTNLTNQAIVEYSTKTIGLPCAFLLLTFKYHSKSTRLFVVTVIILAILFAIIRGRRGLIFLSVSPLVFAYFIYVAESKVKILLTTFSLILICITSIYAVKIIESAIFDSVKERGIENTRANVELSFYNDMTVTDLFVGRGLNGKYYCPGIDPGSSPYRTTIETGFLQIVLKGGFISLGLLLVIVVPASIKGIFYSNNMLSRAAGFWILLWLMSLYPANANTFTMSYLLVWISVGICYSKTLRKMPESLMITYFRSGHKIVHNI